MHLFNNIFQVTKLFLEIIKLKKKLSNFLLPTNQIVNDNKKTSFKSWKFYYHLVDNKKLHLRNMHVRKKKHQTI